MSNHALSPAAGTSITQSPSLRSAEMQPTWQTRVKGSPVTLATSAGENAGAIPAERCKPVADAMAEGLTGANWPAGANSRAERGLSATTRTEGATARARAAALVFFGGACYGFNATCYKLSYAA